MEDNTNAPSPQPPAERPWEVPFAQAAPPQQGQPPTAVGPFGSSPSQQRPTQTPPVFQPRVAKRRLGLSIGAIAIVVVVGVIAAGVVGFLLFRDKVTGAIRTGLGSGPPGTVLVDGQPLDIQSGTTCRKSRDTGNIWITVDANQGITAVVIDANPPQLDLAGLGKINGATLGYNQAVSGNTATVTRDGNTFKISGTASGVDMANPLQLIKKQFEITATCPNL